MNEDYSTTVESTTNYPKVKESTIDIDETDYFSHNDQTVEDNSDIEHPDVDQETIVLSPNSNKVTVGELKWINPELLQVNPQEFKVICEGDLQNTRKPFFNMNFHISSTLKRIGYTTVKDDITPNIKKICFEAIYFPDLQKLLKIFKSINIGKLYFEKVSGEFQLKLKKNRFHTFNFRKRFFRFLKREIIAINKRNIDAAELFLSDSSTGKDNEDSNKNLEEMENKLIVTNSPGFIPNKRFLSIFSENKNLRELLEYYIKFFIKNHKKAMMKLLEKFGKYYLNESISNEDLEMLIKDIIGIKFS